jgi:hypothetical protein
MFSERVNARPSQLTLGEASRGREMTVDDLIAELERYRAVYYGGSDSVVHVSEARKYDGVYEESDIDRVLAADSRRKSPTHPGSVVRVCKLS